MPVMEKEKSALTAEENQILSMSEKIQQNLKQDESFANELDSFLGSDKKSDFLHIGDTSNALALSGANQDLQVVIAPRTIVKCMSEADEHYHGHGLDADTMKQLPAELRNPVMILKGNKENSLVAITQLQDKENRPIMVAVSLSEKKGFHEVNRIASAYGRNNMGNYLDKQLNQGNLIAANQERAEELLNTMGLQLPDEKTFISFDDSIAYTMQGVRNEIERADEMLHSAGLQSPLENTSISSKSNNSITHSEGNVKTSDEKRQAPVQKESLLPILNSIHQSHEERIESLSDRIDSRQGKMEKNEARIEKLSAKAERLQATNEMLKGLSGGVLSSVVNLMIDRNQRKIDKIQNVSIPKHEAKIEKHNDRIATLEHKIAVSQAKADKLQGLSGVIKSFAVLNPEKRRQEYAQSMDLLHDASRRSLSFKIEKCDTQIARLSQRYEKAENTTEQLSIQGKIQAIQDRREELSARIEKIERLPINFSEQSSESIDGAMQQTGVTIESTANNMTLSRLAEEVAVDGTEYLRTAEMSMEQNYNQIDGVINNLPPEQEHFYDEQMEETQQDNIEKSHTEEVLEDEKTSEKSFLLALADEEKAEIHKDGSFVIRPDYYHQISPENLHMETYPAEQAMTILESLAAMGIAFSAISVQDNSVVTIALDKHDDIALQEFAAIAAKNIQEKVDEFLSPEKSPTKGERGKDKPKEEVHTSKINPEYYASIPKSERVTTVVSPDSAKKIMQTLDNQDVSYSAVERGKTAVAITVAKSDVQNLTSARAEAQKLQTKEFINPEFYQQLPKEDRYTQRMTADEARQAVSELQKEGVSHSAVIDGNKSAVTIHKKDKGAVFFSRKQLHQQHEKAQKQEQQQTQHRSTKRGKEEL